MDIPAHQDDSAAQRLVGLAIETWGELLSAEHELLRAVTTGSIAFESSAPVSSVLLSRTHSHGQDRRVRAEIVRWLSTESAVLAYVSRKGVRMVGVLIDGPLDLEDCRIPVPLVLLNCALPSPVNLARAELHSLNLNGCWCYHTRALLEVPSETSAISADRLTIEHDLLMAHGFVVFGEVQLHGAKVGGQLNCNGALFANERGDALSADGLRVGKGLFLGDGFHAKGEVRLIGASIGGQLNARGGTFENPSGDTVSADRMTVNGDVVLDEGLTSLGTFRLASAQITGQLSLRDGLFVNPGGVALHADNLHLVGSAFIDYGFEARGEV